MCQLSNIVPKNTLRNTILSGDFMLILVDSDNVCFVKNLQIITIQSINQLTSPPLKNKVIRFDWPSAYYGGLHYYVVLFY